MYFKTDDNNNGVQILFFGNTHQFYKRDSYHYQHKFIKCTCCANFNFTIELTNTQKCLSTSTFIHVLSLGVNNA